MSRALMVSHLAGTLGLFLAFCAPASATDTILPGATATPPPMAGGVDGTVVDAYPDFVPLPVRILPAKGELPPQYRVSTATPFVLNCDGVAANGTLFANAEVEPHVAVNPLNPKNLVGAWQQDRWSSGGARGVVAATSFDGGSTWNQIAMPFSRCGGGNSGNGGNYARATDPWVTFSPDGTAHQMALGFTSGGNNAMLASRSLDGGFTWSNPATLIVDGSSFFNDKNAITADPTDSNFVYAVWDRLVNSPGGGPSYFARTINGGATWQTAKPIYDPGVTSQTIGNLIVVLPNGTLVDLFTQLDDAGNGQTTSTLAVIRSTNKGATWSSPSVVSSLLAVGASDPETGTPIRDGSILAQMAVDAAGSLYVVWSDSRFSGGVRDGIAISRSNNGGLTWSAPVQVNGDPNVQAFMPQVHVSADGTIGVTYYDLRSNTSDPATLLADYWIARSIDGLGWSESRVVAPFDLATAPNAGGLFVGDYHGLVSIGSVFVPFFAKTNSGDFSNRNDVFAAPATFVVRTSVNVGKQAPALLTSAQLRRRVHENIVRNMNWRIPGWSENWRWPRRKSLP